MTPTGGSSSVLSSAFWASSFICAAPSTMATRDHPRPTSGPARGPGRGRPAARGCPDRRRSRSGPRALRGQTMQVRWFPVKTMRHARHARHGRPDGSAAVHSRPTARSSARVVFPTAGGPTRRTACGGVPFTIRSMAASADDWPRVRHRPVRADAAATLAGSVIRSDGPVAAGPLGRSSLRRLGLLRAGARRFGCGAPRPGLRPGVWGRRLGPGRATALRRFGGSRRAVSSRLGGSLRLGGRSRRRRPAGLRGRAADLRVRALGGLRPGRVRRFGASAGAPASAPVAATGAAPASRPRLAGRSSDRFDTCARRSASSSGGTSLHGSSERAVGVRSRSGVRSAGHDPRAEARGRHHDRFGDRCRDHRPHRFCPLPPPTPPPTLRPVASG